MALENTYVKLWVLHTVNWVIVSPVLYLHAHHTLQQTFYCELCFNTKHKEAEICFRSPSQEMAEIDRTQPTCVTPEVNPSIAWYRNSHSENSLWPHKSLVLSWKLTDYFQARGESLDCQEFWTMPMLKQKSQRFHSNEKFCFQKMSVL